MGAFPLYVCTQGETVLNALRQGELKASHVWFLFHNSGRKRSQIKDGAWPSGLAVTLPFYVQCNQSVRLTHFQKFLWRSPCCTSDGWLHKDNPHAMEMRMGVCVRARVCACSCVCVAAPVAGQSAAWWGGDSSEQQPSPQALLFCCTPSFIHTMCRHREEVCRWGEAPLVCVCLWQTTENDKRKFCLTTAR